MVTQEEILDIFEKVTFREIESALRYAFETDRLDYPLVELSDLIFNSRDQVGREARDELLTRLQRNVIAVILDHLETNNTELVLKEAIEDVVLTMYRDMCYVICSQFDNIYHTCEPDEQARIKEAIARYERDKSNYVASYKHWSRMKAMGGGRDRDYGNGRDEQHNDRRGQPVKNRRVNMATIGKPVQSQTEQNVRREIQSIKKVRRKLPMVIRPEDFDYDLGVDVNLLMPNGGISNIDNLEQPSKLEDIKNQQLQDLSDESLVQEYDRPLKIGPVCSPSIDHAVESAKQIALSRSDKFNVNNVLDIKTELIEPLYVFTSIEEKNERYSEVPELLALQKLEEAEAILNAITELKQMIDNRFVVELAAKLDKKIVTAANDFICYDLGYFAGEYPVRSSADVIPVIGTWVQDMGAKYGEKGEKEAIAAATKFSYRIKELVKFNNHIDKRASDLWGSEELLTKSTCGIYSVEEVTIVDMPIFAHELKVAFEDFKCVLDGTKTAGSMIYNVVNNAHKRNEADKIYFKFIDGSVISSIQLISEETKFQLEKVR